MHLKLITAREQTQAHRFEPISERRARLHDKLVVFRSGRKLSAELSGKPISQVIVTITPTSSAQDIYKNICFSEKIEL